MEPIDILCAGLGKKEKWSIQFLSMRKGRVLLGDPILYWNQTCFASEVNACSPVAGSAGFASGDAGLAGFEASSRVLSLLASLRSALLANPASTWRKARLLERASKIPESLPGLDETHVQHACL